MSWTVLAGADRVVCRNMDLMQALERCHAYSGRGVDIKDEEGACYGQECPLVERREAVGNGAHGVFTDAVVDITATVLAVQVARGPKRGLQKVNITTQGHLERLTL